jgi:hypothetical protein
MIRPAIIFVFAATILCFAGCGSDEDQKPTKFHQTHSTTETQMEEVAPGPDSAVPPSAPGEPKPNSSPTLPPAQPSSPAPSVAPAATPGAIPYGKPVAGMPGFVTSPYSPKAGYVDVRGFPPGTEVKDPYTQKVFLVP